MSEDVFDRYFVASIVVLFGAVLAVVLGCIATAVYGAYGVTGIAWFLATLGVMAWAVHAVAKMIA